MMKYLLLQALLMLLLLGENLGSISTWQTKELEGADLAFADIDMRYLYIEQYLY